MFKGRGHGKEATNGSGSSRVGGFGGAQPWQLNPELLAQLASSPVAGLQGILSWAASLSTMAPPPLGSEIAQDDSAKKTIAIGDPRLRRLLPPNPKGVIWTGEDWWKWCETHPSKERPLLEDRTKQKATKEQSMYQVGTVYGQAWVKVFPTTGRLNISGKDKGVRLALSALEPLTRLDPSESKKARRKSKD